MHTKGVAFPKERRCGESSDVGSSAAFWGCPSASDWKWLQHSWIKATSKGQSIIPASLLIIAKPKKLYIHKTVSAPWCFVPAKHFSRGLAIWGALPMGTMPPGPTLLPQLSPRATSWGLPSPRVNRPTVTPQYPVGRLTYPVSNRLSQSMFWATGNTLC